MLVGRDAELAVLDALITQARAGGGGVVLLTGEPGVGKTRLAQAGTEHAAGTTAAPRTLRGLRPCSPRADPGSAAALGGQDAADVRGLLVAVPVEDRVQVVQVGRAVVTG